MSLILEVVKQEARKQKYYYRTCNDVILLSRFKPPWYIGDIFAEFNTVDQTFYLYNKSYPLFNKHTSAILSISDPECFKKLKQHSKKFWKK